VRRAALAGALLLSGCGPACPGEPRDLAACEAACERGDAVGCAWAGELTRANAIALGGAALDDAVAQVFFERACEHATPSQRHLCLLSMPLAEPPSAEQRARLRALCDEGLLLACHELLRTLTVARSIRIDAPPVAPLFVDGVPTTLDALATLEAERAVIAADREVEHGRVVQVIDALRRGGVTRYAIQVEPAE
jgi:hypothetical protein